MLPTTDAPYGCLEANDDSCSYSSEPWAAITTTAIIGSYATPTVSGHTATLVKTRDIYEAISATELQQLLSGPQYDSYRITWKDCYVILVNTSVLPTTDAPCGCPQANGDSCSAVQNLELRSRCAAAYRAPSAQLGPGVLHHRDQSGAHFLRRADRLAERQTDGSWSLWGHRRHVEAVPVDARHARGGDLGRL